uniref:Uncharacterized protein n=1 Tax=Manihot esculenta TaxID=3983 RepID=A0A2C9UUS6_MANES
MPLAGISITGIVDTQLNSLLIFYRFFPGGCLIFLMLQFPLLLAYNKNQQT